MKPFLLLLAVLFDRQHCNAKWFSGRRCNANPADGGQNRCSAKTENKSDFSAGAFECSGQADRGKAYRYYVEEGLARPELIGMHYFQWLDQPVFGRFDGENYNIGFMDICNRPYKELVEAAKQTHLKMYEVAAGKEKPFNEVIEKIPSIHY